MPDRRSFFGLFTGGLVTLLGLWGLPPEAPVSNPHSRPPNTVPVLLRWRDGTWNRQILTTGPMPGALPGVILRQHPNKLRGKFQFLSKFRHAHPNDYWAVYEEA